MYLLISHGIIVGNYMKRKIKVMFDEKMVKLANGKKEKRKK